MESSNTKSLISIKSFIVLIFIITLSGSSFITPICAKSSNSLFQTFYVGKEGTQYFIKPLTFVNSQNKGEIKLDFTFRYRNEIKDSVTVNFSLLNSKIFKNIDSISFTNTTTRIISKNIKLMFNEKAKELFKSRFTTNISLEEFNKMFTNNNWKIIVSSFGTDSTYFPNKKTKKDIEKLRNEIFILF